MKKIIIAIVATAVVVFGLCFLIAWGANAYNQGEMRAQQEELFQHELDDVMIPQEWYLEDGFDNIHEWWQTSINTKQEAATIASSTVEEWGEWLTPEQETLLMELSEKIQNSHSVNEMQECIQETEVIKVQAEEAKIAAEEEAAKAKEAEVAVLSANSGGGGNASSFKSQGVIYQNGYRYTWYSSRVLRHYRTSEWTAGSDGIYRDSQGYIIVASSDHPQGTIVPTPFGSGIVRDSGCAHGTLDIYTNF